MLPKKLIVASSEFQGENQIGENSPPSKTQWSTEENTDSLSFFCDAGRGAEDANVPLPAFEQDFGSTEIGSYSKEGFFGAPQEVGIQQFINNDVSVNSALDYNNYVGPTLIRESI
jgi:hypothetical protein